LFGLWEARRLGRFLFVSGWCLLWSNTQAICDVFSSFTIDSSIVSKWPNDEKSEVIELRSLNFDSLDACWPIRIMYCFSRVVHTPSACNRGRCFVIIQNVHNFGQSSATAPVSKILKPSPGGVTSQSLDRSMYVGITELHASNLELVEPSSCYAKRSVEVGFWVFQE
jgi:hypothetical protein